MLLDGMAFAQRAARQILKKLREHKNSDIHSHPKDGLWAKKRMGHIEDSRSKIQ